MGLFVLVPLAVATYAFCMWSFIETSSDRTFRKRLPTKQGISEAEIVAALGEPVDVVRPADPRAAWPFGGGYSFAAYAGVCGDLPAWGQRQLAPPRQLPKPTGKLLWYTGKSILVAGYYLDESGRLTCVVLGAT